MSEQIKISGEMSRAEWWGWLDNIKLFGAILGLSYIEQISATMALSGGINRWEDLLPNQFTLGAGLFFLKSILVDYLKKRQEGVKKEAK